MRILKSTSLFIIFFLLLPTYYMVGNVIINTYLFNVDSVRLDEKKIEYLIKTSSDVEKYSLSLSLDAILQAYSLSTESKNSYLKAECNKRKGIILSKLNKTEQALIALKAALTYYGKEEDKKSTAKILVNIGNTYSNNKQLTKSIMYYNSALAEFTKLGDSLNIVNCYTHLGQANMSLGEKDKAIKYYKHAINISNINNYKFQLAYNHLKLGNLQLSYGLADSTLRNINIAMRIAEKYEFSTLISDAYLLSSMYYSSIDDQTSASLQMRKYIRLSDSSNTVKTKEFKIILDKLKDKGSASKKSSNNNLRFWLIIIVLVIVILFLINKVVKLRVTFIKQISFITEELNAFEENKGELKETIKIKTIERINEIKGQIDKNKKINHALNNSLNNLNHVNTLKDLFLSKISHEIRTPLSGILGFSEILETELALLEDQMLFEFANGISQSGQSLVLLLNNILDISKLDSNKMLLEFKQLNTKELIQGVVDKHYHEASLKGIKLIYANETIPNIHTDGQMFTKIISQILSNSIKFTEKGFIKISHYHDEKNNRISIIIKDTGIGIDKVYINQVFEPFRQESLGYSTSYQGAGLGLPLAKKMSIKLKGDIKIESEKGNGTTITLSFPSSKTESTVNSKLKSPKTTFKSDIKDLPWDNLSILVVEDDNMNQILYRKLLSSASILEIAKDGKSALTIIENEVANNNFQLVLMDINLPPPWDGISLMKEIRHRWSSYNNIPFVAQTAYAISGNREMMLDEGFDEYITKPIIKSTLAETIKKVLDKQY